MHSVDRTSDLSVVCLGGYVLLSRRSRQRERLSASVLSICSSVSLSIAKMQKNAIFSKTKQFRATVSIDDL